MTVIPKEAEERYYEIEKILENFTMEYLNGEYNELALRLWELLCRKNYKKILKGKVNVWACAIIHVIGKINFLFDESENLHMKAKELYSLFQVSSSSVTKRSNEICKLLDIAYLDIEWTLPSNKDKNPLTWLINLDGFITDVRYSSKFIQDKAIEKKLFDSIPTYDIENDDNDEILLDEEFEGNSLEEILDLNTLLDILENESELELIDSNNISKIKNLSEMEGLIDLLCNKEECEKPKCKIIQFPVKEEK